MKTVELFSGTGSFSRVALELGHGIRTYDLADSADELKDGTHTQSDILNIHPNTCATYPDNTDILWASPPCQTFSIASCSTHWTPDKEPKTEECVKGLRILWRTVELIHELKPQWWFIENPRGLMRKVCDPYFKKYGLKPIRHTVTYCQYGDSRMKPTDIWTNAHWWKPRPVCKNGDPCHVRAPRGSSTGTQGIKESRNRSRIPSELFVEIFEQLKKEEQQ